MRKQVLSILSMTMVSALTLTWIQSTYAQDTLDLDSLDGLITETETTDTANSTGVTVVNSIDNINIVHAKGNSIPANEETQLMVSVTSNGEKLDDTQVSLIVNANGDLPDVGRVWVPVYNTDWGYFEVPYTAGNSAGNVQFSIKATALSNPSITLEQGDELNITEAVRPVEEEPIISTEAETTTETSTGEVTNTDEVTVVETEEANKWEEDKKIEANIKSTKVIGENKLVIYFDRELFLPEEPLSLITITKVKDSSDVKVSNVALGEDKKSLVVLTTDKLGKEEYRLTINEVVDGKTKKRINVVNGTLTITGLTEIAVLILGLITFSGIFFLRKKK